MTRAEAILATLRGKKVTHQYFDKGEYVYFAGNRFWGEDLENFGTLNDEFWTIRSGGYWENDWSIFTN